jgi:hypothetical protein
MPTVGNVIGNRVLKLDPEKVEAIKSFQTLENQQDLERFLGMVNY